MNLPHDWDTVGAPGLPDLRHLIHSTCGWVSYLPHNPETDLYTVRRIITGHNCQAAREVTFT